MSIDNNIDFKDHIVEYPNRFKMTTVSPGIVELVPTWIETPGQIIQDGTPVNEDLFEKLKNNVTCYSQTYTATEGQTVFPVSHPYNVGQSRISVYVGGVKQRTIVDFTEASSTSFILNVGLPAGTKVEAVTISFVQPLASDVQQQIDSMLQQYGFNTVRINEVNLEVSKKANKSYVDTLLTSLGSGSPKGVFSTLGNLQVAKPTGDSNIYVVSADGKWYYWNGTSWVAGGVYQATELPIGSVTDDKTDFLKPYLNLIDEKRLVGTHYLKSSDGTLVPANVQYPTNTTAHYIKIKPGTGYYRNYVYMICWYNINKVFISTTYDAVSDLLLTSPANAEYARVSFIPNAAINGTILAESTAPVAYQKYKLQQDNLIVKQSNLDSDVLSLLANTPNADTVVSNTNKGLKKWKSSIAKLQTGQNTIVNLNVIGTSIASGGVASNYQKTSWLGLLRDMFANKFGNVGFGAIPTFYQSSYNVFPWSFTGTWSTQVLFGIMGDCKLSTQQGSTATLTFDGTGIRILAYTGASCGKFLVSIDGNVPTEFDTYAATAVPCKHFEIKGLTEGTHTVVITQNETGKNLILIGAYPLTGTKGIRVNAVCKSGGSTANVTWNENVLKANVDYWEPTLTIIEFMTNDYNAQVSLAAYRSTMQTLITRAKQYGDVLLLPNGIRTENKAIKQTDYINVIRELALTNDVVMLDTFNRWGGNYEYANTQLGYLYDTVHPNDVGHRDIYNFLYKYLVES